jgi:hypothetical protein
LGLIVLMGRAFHNPQVNGGKEVVAEPAEGKSQNAFTKAIGKEESKV